jgi:hypothetical protein
MRYVIALDAALRLFGSTSIDSASASRCWKARPVESWRSHPALGRDERSEGVARPPPHDDCR